ncbi:MAG: DUF305 domain-containing protein [Gemmatimonadaceae bacterium]
MTPSHTSGITAALLAAVVAVACSRATQGAAQTSNQPAIGASSGANTASNKELAALAKARSDSALQSYTAADARFMSGMIGHHAQAITMASWAPTHGATAVRTLAARIINSQQDEIATMQQWLRDRGQPVPQANAAGMKMMMNGTEHTMLMPGMLTDAQMRQLDQAKGAEFDRLFLTDMIQHHRGAVSMVKDLFDTYGAAQCDLTFKIASDINGDQTTEIARMEKMLVTLLFQRGSQ